MKHLVMAALALGAATFAASADATVMRGTYAGIIVAGYAQGAFGYANQTDVTGQSITGSFQYDTDAFSGRCDGGQVWFQCFRAPGAITITQVVNGVEELFISTPALPGAPYYNVGDGGVAHYTLSYEALELGARSLRGEPATQFDQYETHIGVGLPTGRAGVDVVADGMPTYSGAASSSSAGTLGPSFNDIQINHTRILALTGGDLTKNTAFRFDITAFSIAAVPEPASWAMMIGGFGMIGGTLRRRRAGKVYA